MKDSNWYARASRGSAHSEEKDDQGERVKTVKCTLCDQELEESTTYVCKEEDCKIRLCSNHAVTLGGRFVYCMECAQRDLELCYDASRSSPLLRFVITRLFDETKYDSKKVMELILIESPKSKDGTICFEDDRVKKETAKLLKTMMISTPIIKKKAPKESPWLKKKEAKKKPVLQRTFLEIEEDKCTVCNRSITTSDDCHLCDKCDLIICGRCALRVIEGGMQNALCYCVECAENEMNDLFAAEHDTFFYLVMSWIFDENKWVIAKIIGILQKHASFKKDKARE